MDLDNVVLWESLRSKGDFLKVLAGGVSQDILTKAPGQAFKFIQQYVDKYGDVPAPMIVREVTGLEILPPTDEVNLAYLVDKLFERDEFNLMQRGYLEIGPMLEEGRTVDARDRWLGVGDALGERRSKRMGLVTLADAVDQVKQNYLDTKSGKMGVPFPWPTLNSWTRGMKPGTLTFVISRPAMGKTWMISLTMLYGWLQGLKVLVVSPEIDAVELAERVICAKVQLAYTGMVSGMLSTYSENIFFDAVEQIRNDAAAKRFLIYDDEDRMDPDAIYGAVESESPDEVGVDAAYMLQVTKFGKANEKFAETVGWMRRSAKRSNKAWIGISQLSRDATKIDEKSKEQIKAGTATGGVENTAAKSDELLWGVHNLFSLYRDPDMTLANQMLIMALKIRRRAAPGMSVLCNWDLDTMNFSEIEGAAEEFKDEGFSTHIY